MESLDKIREGLAKRKQECELQGSWFNASPWLTNYHILFSTGTLAHAYSDPDNETLHIEQASEF